MRATTGAGEEDGARVAGAVERLGQLGDELRVEGVPTLGAGERDADNRPIPLDSKGTHTRAA